MRNHYICVVLMLILSNIPSNETTNNWVSDLRNKIFKMENSAKDPFSNFQQQQLANHLLFLITYFIKKLTEWQWVLLWVPRLQIHFYAIMKMNGQIIIQSVLNLRYTEGMLICFCVFFVFFFHLKTLPTFCSLYEQRA